VHLQVRKFSGQDTFPLALCSRELAIRSPIGESLTLMCRAPPPPRRRKKGVRDVDVHARLRIYEDALLKVGIDPEELVKKEMSKSKKRATKAANSENAEESDDDPAKLSAGPTTGGHSNAKGVLISTGEGKSRYLENTLWTSLDREFRESHELLLDDTSSEGEDHSNDASTPAFSSDDGGLLLGTPKAASLRPLHPQPVQMFKLWQAYLDNCNPILKIFHSPSVQQILSNASGDLDNLPKNVEALLFSIYTMAVQSLGESECYAIMGEPKTVVSQR
jgi:hypothetical protein